MKPGGKKKEKGRSRPLTPCLLWKQGRISFIGSADGRLGSFYGQRDKVDPVRKSRRSLQCVSRSYVELVPTRGPPRSAPSPHGGSLTGTLCFLVGWGARRFRIPVFHKAMAGWASTPVPFGLVTQYSPLT